MQGIYRHFKGGLYYVEGTATHSETGEEFVVYRNADGKLWVRPRSMFEESVDKPEHRGPRFEKVSKT